MKSLRQQLLSYFLSNDSWMFMAVVIVISTLQTSAAPQLGWDTYLSITGITVLIFSPTILATAYRAKLQSILNKLGFWAGWTFLFLAYPLLTGWACSTWLSPYLATNTGSIVLVTGGVFVVLEGVLLLQQHIKNPIQNKRWLQKISIGQALLIMILLVALFFGFAAVSDLDDFYSRQPIDLNFSFTDLATYFPDFVSITFQLFITYLAGYFFYYLNHHFLVGKLLRKRGILAYLIGVCGSAALFYPLLAQLLMLFPLHQQYQYLAPSENMLSFDPINGSVALGIVALSLPLILATEWFQQNNRITTLQKQQAQTKLDLLKQQINPHFFFNTLNNLYALSRKQSQQTPEVIMQLSDLMRYVIYKGREQQVLLTEEVQYIRDYISLQRIRLHQSLDYHFEVEIEDESMQIPPLMLIILVENAFKHGIEPADESAMLHLKLESDSRSLYFRSQNTYEKNTEDENGIGLQNLRRRLDLLYEEQYQLNITEQDAIFKAELRINLS